MVKYLQTIKEEEEHENEMSHNYDAMNMLGVSPMNSPDKNMRRGTGKKSFIGGSFIG